MMKILVREWTTNENNTNICNYVWKNVTLNDSIREYHYITEDGNSYPVEDVIKITGDYRLSKTKYVRCKNCGKIFKESEAINHYTESETKMKCVGCEWFKLEKRDGEKAKVTLRDDGTAIVKTISNAMCTKGEYHWYSERYEPVNTVDKVAHCKFFRCRREGYEELHKDFLSDHPNPIENLLTESAAISGGWRYVTSDRFGRQYSNSNGRVIANFDTNGILRYFTVLFKGDSCNFCYSDKYDMFYSHRGEYNWSVNWHTVSETSRNRYMKQIRALYKKNSK